MEEAMETEEEHKFGSFLDELKRKLDKHMDPTELYRMAWLMRDKLEREFIPLNNCALPSDVVTHLEKTMLRREVISVLKHVVGVLKFHGDFGALDFYKYIEHYETTIASPEEENLIGREEDIRQIFAKFEMEKCKAVWIHGIGGLGKTTLAKTIGLRARFNMKWDFISVDLKKTIRTADMFRFILGQFSCHSEESDVECLMADVLSKIEMVQKDTLLLLDNVEDIQDADRDGVNNFLASLLPKCGDKVRIIVTSRNRLSAVRESNIVETITGAVEYDLGELADEDAQALLRLFCKPKRLSNDVCQQALTYCSNIPLALRLLSNAIRNLPGDQVTSSEIHTLKRGQCEMEDRIAYAYEKLCPELKGFAIHLTVFETATFDINDVAEVLEKPKQETSMLLMYLCYCHMLNKVETQPGANNITDIVSANSYVMANFKYSFHNLIFDWLQKQQNALSIPMEEFQIRSCKRILRSMRSVFGDYYSNSEKCIQYVTANNARFRIFFRGPQLGLFDESMELDDCRNIYTVSSLMLTHQEKTEMMRNSDEYLKNVKPECFAQWRVEEAAYLIDAGDTDRAESILRSSDISKLLASLSVTNPRTSADYYIHLGRLMRMKRNIVEAKEALVKALKLLQDCTPVDDHLFSRTAYALNTFGNVYFDSKNFKKSLEYHKQAVEEMQRINRNNRPTWPYEMSVYKFNIGTVALAKARQLLSRNPGDKEKAKKDFDLCFAQFDESLNNDRALRINDRPKFAERLNVRAKACIDVEDFKGAEQDATEALKVITKTYEGPHWRKTMAKYLCGRVYLTWSEALKKQSNSERGTGYLKQAREMFDSAVRDIYEGGLSIHDSEATNFLHDYQRMANATMNERYKNSVKEFCMEFRRKGKYDPEVMSEEDTSSEDGYEVPDSPMGSAQMSPKSEDDPGADGMEYEEINAVKRQVSHKRKKDSDSD